MNKRQQVGIIGGVVLILGIFAPLIKIQIYGSKSYFSDGGGYGIFILLLGLITILFAYKKVYKGLLATACLSIALNTFIFMGMLESISGVDTRNLPGQLSWGWGILIVGTVLILLCAVMSDQQHMDNYDY